MTDYNKIEAVKQLILQVLAKADIGANVEFEDSITKGLVFNISTSESYLLIGKQGTTLHALQILVQAMAAKKFGDQPFYFSLDVDDYKRKREWFIKESTKEAAEQVKKTGRSVALEPMPNYERRLAHAYLQEHFPELDSSSVGEDPYRKIVIKVKR